MVRYSTLPRRFFVEVAPDSGWPQQAFNLSVLPPVLRTCGIDARLLRVTSVDVAFDLPIAQEHLAVLRGYARRTAQFNPDWPEPPVEDFRGSLYVGAKRSVNLAVVYDKAKEQWERRGREIEGPLTRVELRLRPRCRVIDLFRHYRGERNPARHLDLRLAQKPGRAETGTYPYWHRFRRRREALAEVYCRCQARAKKAKTRQYFKTLPVAVDIAQAFADFWPQACRDLLRGLGIGRAARTRQTRVLRP